MEPSISVETIAKVEIEKLTFPNEDKPVLKNINFEIYEGDFIVITGGAASGKSVLLHSLTGAIPHYHNAELIGKITIMGQDIKDVRLNQMSDYIGYMMQEPQNQITSLEVYEEIAFGLGNLEIPLNQIEEKVKNSLELVGLAGSEKRQTASLSGGQVQRVVLASVLALDAPILILDQPTAELDPQGRQELYKRLGQLNKNKKLTIVMVMDRIEEVLQYADKVLLIREGEIVNRYLPEEYYDEQIKYRQELFRANTIIHKDNSYSKDIITEISNISYNYKNNILGCEEINLKIYKGDFLSIIGLNGSGKSTLAKLLIGLLKPANGNIKVFNKPLNDKKNLTEIRNRVGFLFQNPDFQIFASTVEEEAGFSLKLRGEQSSVVDQKVDECLEFVGLLDYKQMHPQRLSRGQRQLLALASILAGDPEFIIADEPTSGLDEHQGYLILNKLYDLSKNGKTILLITHDLTMVREYSNRLVVLHQHRIHADFLIKDLDEHIDMLKAIGLNFDNSILNREA